MQPWLDAWHVEGAGRLRLSWSLPSVTGPLVGDGFLLRLWDMTQRQERWENISSLQDRTTLLTGLTPGAHYQLDVRLYHCTLLGPASPPAHVVLPHSGTPIMDRVTGWGPGQDRGHRNMGGCWKRWMQAMQDTQGALGKT